ncbi:zinc-binding dehydrogenase [bacterium]|nr:zinc-binding dehydrogenase [bacterium]
MADFEALVCASLNDDLSNVEVGRFPVVAPGPGEVRVRVEAAGLNFPDVLMLSGGYQHRAEPPYVIGMEYSGVVDEVGDGVNGLRSGDRVVGGGKTGACAQYVVADAATLRRTPDTLTDSEAAGFQTIYLTAYVTLVELARTQPGEVVLVHGASGGVGLAALDVAKVIGARVIAATGSPDKIGALRSLGHDPVIDGRPGFRDAVKDLSGGGGVDVVVDPVGGDVFDESMRCVAFGARLMVVGFTGGRPAEVKTNHALIKGVSIIGVRAGEYSRRKPERGRAATDQIWAWAREGRIRPVIHREFSLGEGVAGLRELATRSVVGKVIVRPWA